MVGNVSDEANESHEACHVYTYHATFTPKMKADELIQRMWDEDVVGIADQNKRLTAEEVLAARKEAQSRRYVAGA